MSGRGREGARREAAPGPTFARDVGFRVGTRTARPLVTADLAVGPLAPERAAEAAAVLARAFDADPAWVWALPDPRRRARVLPWFFRAAIRYALRHGEVVAAAGDGRLRGAAIVLPPARPTLDARGLVRAGLWQMPLRAGARGFARFVVQGRVLDDRHARDVPPRHGYVWLIGVDEGARGGGIGSAVLRTVTARRDAEGVPTYLDTTNERNLPFYARHGFAIAHAGAFPRGGCRYWTLVRPPGAGGGGSGTMPSPSGYSSPSSTPSSGSGAPASSKRMRQRGRVASGPASRRARA